MAQSRVFTMLGLGLLLLLAGCAPQPASGGLQTSSVALIATTTSPALATTPTKTAEPPTPTTTISPPTVTAIATVVPGIEGNASSGYSALSADGRFVAFQSLASNLVAGDTNGVADIFVHDRQTGKTERVSIASDGAQANDASTQPSISANGRWIAFTSSASNLVPDERVNCRGYGSHCPSIFVYDRQSQETERVSVASDGTPGNAPSYAPAISADGRYVAFVSDASNLVPDDKNRKPDIFVHDRQTRQTERVNVASDGSQANDWSRWASISADGRFVAFGSAATNLTEENTGGIFVRDRETSTIEWVSRGFAPTISADGRWIAFLARDEEATGWLALFVYDRQTDEMTRVRIIAEDIHGSPGREISMSFDGRWIAFWAVHSDSLTGIPKAYTEVLVYDRETGMTELVSISSNGTPSNGGSGHPHISGDGRWIAFESWGDNLVAGDTNEVSDIFVRDRIMGQTERVSISGK